MNKEHSRIWKVIDKIAYLNGMSVSALAMKAGLHSTSFSKNKRFYQSGRCRWLSIYTVNRVLKVSKIDWQEFGKYMMEMENEIDKD